MGGLGPGRIYSIFMFVYRYCFGEQILEVNLKVPKMNRFLYNYVKERSSQCQLMSSDLISS